MTNSDVFSWKKNAHHLPSRLTLDLQSVAIYSPNLSFPSPYGNIPDHPTIHSLYPARENHHYILHQKHIMQFCSRVSTLFTIIELIMSPLPILTSKYTVHSVLYQIHLRLITPHWFHHLINNLPLTRVVLLPECNIPLEFISYCP